MKPTIALVSALVLAACSPEQRLLARATEAWTLAEDDAPRIPGLRADHPDMAGHAVVLKLYWNARPLLTLKIEDPRWKTVTLSRARHLGRKAGILSFHVDRTWNPDESGVSSDARDLGVAVSEVSWR